MNNAAHKITYESFTERVARRANVNDTEADAYIHQFAKTAGDALENGDDVQLYHFGRFRTTHVDERPGNNPQTGEALTVPEHTRVDFQPYKALLLAVNFPFRHLRTRMLPEKETDIGSKVILWLLLALALVALILFSIGLYDWISSPNSAVAAPAETPATMAPQQPVIQPVPAATATETGTTANVAADTATGTASDAPIEPVAAPVATTTNFLVTPGDTLWGISQSQWGDTSWWPVIYAENRPDLAARNPDFIETGSALRIPVLAGSPAQPADADLRQKANAYRIVADDYARLNHPRAAEYRRFVNRGFDGF